MVVVVVVAVVVVVVAVAVDVVVVVAVSRGGRKKSEKNVFLFKKERNGLSKVLFGCQVYCSIVAAVAYFFLSDQAI